MTIFMEVSLRLLRTTIFLLTSSLQPSLTQTGRGGQLLSPVITSALNTGRGVATLMQMVNHK